MGIYLLRRLLGLIPVLLGLTLLVFAMLHLVPGDVAITLGGSEATAADLTNIRRKLGLDQPLYVQYGRFLWHVLHGELGVSHRTGAPVAHELRKRAPATAQLALSALFLAVVGGMGLGTLSAARHNTIWDQLASGLAVLGICLPVYWLGLLLMWLFAVYLGWLPTSGQGGFMYLILPAISLSTTSTAIIARMTRSAMLDVLRQDYIRTALAKGVRGSVIVWRHALQNALIPIITVIGLQAGYLFAGSVLTETVFNWNGLGRLAVDAIKERDMPLVQGTILLFGVTFALVNLLVDLLYAYVNPRIRLD